VLASKRTHAVIIGGSVAGMLAASVVARHVDRVTVVERDEFPPTPVVRKGVPQGEHTHLLWSGGARVIESLLPGFTSRLRAAGARRMGLPNDVVMLGPYGWLPRFPERQYLLCCSRPLLEQVLRVSALTDSRITVRTGTEATGLLSDGHRVGGVELRDVHSDTMSELAADFVVDATGRGSRATKWLTAFGPFGSGEIRRDIVDAGLTYATRAFRAPRGTLPVISVVPDPRPTVRGQTGILLPIEDGRWLVTLSGTRGAEPPRDEAGFLEFARGLRTPLLAELVATAEPVGPVRGSRSTVNRRLYFEDAAFWPDGFVVLGDAAATFNPVYGHGIGIAALSAAAMNDVLRRRGIAGDSARRVQRAVGRTTDVAWRTAVVRDMHFPDVAGRTPTRVDHLVFRLTMRLMRAATARRAATSALLDVATLASSRTTLLSPRVLAALLWPAPDAGSGPPPLTPAEERSVRGVESRPDTDG
jgi:2-polyprenyl-6-methoxyphenol hydroxylase-like FAD-dependent oxidoreductase